MAIYTETGSVSLGPDISDFKVRVNFTNKQDVPEILEFLYELVVSNGPTTLPRVSTLVTFGDSITSGVAATLVANRWANRLAADLGATLTNAGIGGTVLQNSFDVNGSPRSSNGRNRYVSALLGANKRDLVVIAYGLNDARYTAAPSTFNVVEYQNDYREIMFGLIAGGYSRDRIVIVSPHYITDVGLTTGSAGFTGQTRIGYESFVTATRNVAREFGCYYADTYSAMRDGGGENLIDTDGIHPLDTGHLLIYNTIRKATLALDNFFTYDNFVAPDGIAINVRSGEKNATWVPVGGYIPAIPSLISNNRVYATDQYQVYRTSTPPSADYEVTGTFKCLSVVPGDNVSVVARADPDVRTLYWARYLQGTGWQVYKTVNNSNTIFGTFDGPTMDEGESRIVKLRVQGTTLTLFVDGTQIAQITDSAITAAGYAGIRMGPNTTPTTGIHFEDFAAGPIS